MNEPPLWAVNQIVGEFLPNSLFDLKQQQQQRKQQNKTKALITIL